VLISVLCESEATHVPPEAVRHAFMLWMTLALLALIAMLMLWMMLRRTRRRLTRADHPRGPATSNRSAWEEAGRRAEPITVVSDSSTSGEINKPEDGDRADPAAPDDPTRESNSGTSRSPSQSSGHPPVVLVTGGTKRVGLAIARTFARSGFHVIITYNTTIAKELTDALASIRAAATSQGKRGSVAAERLNLDDLEGVEAFARELASSLPRLDILVHNASIYEATPLQNVEQEDMLRHYRVNALAPLMLTRHLSSLLERSPLPGGGAVVAMADMHVLGRPRRDLIAYSMSKAALVEMVRSLARELAPRVRVNAVAPGVVAFPETGAEADPAMQDAYLKRVPLQRSGTPEDAAEAVRWLALDARYTTGEVIRVDGGRWLA
jgi:pteridine reductase